MGVNITTIAYLRVLIIEIGSTIIFMVVEAQGIYIYILYIFPRSPRPRFGKSSSQLSSVITV